MEASQPIYTDRQAGSFLQFISPAIAGLLLAIGIVQGDAIAIVLGVALAIYIWFTRQFRYEIFPDRLVVHYGKPRRKVVPLEEIQEVRTLKFPLGGQGLFVQRTRGWGMVLRPSNPEEFVSHLEQARRQGG